MSDDVRHHRVHRHARRITFLAAPVIVTALGAWLYLRLFVCWSHRLTESTAMVCGYSAFGPMLLLASAVVAIALIGRELHFIGRELEPSLRSRGSIAAGMRALTPARRRHVAVAVVLVIGLVAGELWLFSQFEVVFPR